MMPLAGEAPFGAGNTPRFTLLAASQEAVRSLVESFSDLLASSVRPPPDGSGISLVRPDGYVACAVAAGDVKSIADYLNGLRRTQ
jgi:hypothetical protein